MRDFPFEPAREHPYVAPVETPGGFVVEIILLAMVALFVGLRLYSVLGQRTGHEQEPLPRGIEPRQQPAPVPQPLADAPAERKEASDEIVAPGAEHGIRRIAAADTSFDVSSFVLGAQSAYRMVLEAYWKGDEKELGYLANDDVRDAFAEAIAEREAEGHVLDNRLVAIENTMIQDAELDGSTARITVRFDADIAAVTRDKEGKVIAGSLSDAVPTHDVWTFARNLRDSDPNWLLVETDEAQ